VASHGKARFRRAATTEEIVPSSAGAESEGKTPGQGPGNDTAAPENCANSQKPCYNKGAAFGGSFRFGVCSAGAGLKSLVLRMLRPKKERWHESCSINNRTPRFRKTQPRGKHF